MPLIPVEPLQHVLAPGGDLLDRHGGGRRHDQRADGEGVRTDRGDDDGIHARDDDRPAGGECVRGRAGGRGHHDPVSRVLAHFVAVHRNAQPNDAGYPPLMHDRVVQHDRLGAALALLVLDERGEGETRLGAVRPAHQGVEGPIERL